MSTVIRTTATVLPGGRIELAAPGLPEGRTVTVEVTVTDPAAPPAPVGIADWIASLPPTKTPEEWEQFERDFRAERDSWER